MSKIIEIEEQKRISLTLRRFLTYLIGSFDKMPVDKQDAELIAAIDKDEEFCHVSFESFEGEPYPRPLVWWIKEWKTSYTRYQLQKQKSEEERKAACLISENTSRLIKAMIAKSGITEDADLIFRKLAYKIAKAQNDKGAAVFKVTIDKGE